MPTPGPQKLSKVTKAQHTKDAARRSHSRNTTPMSRSSVSRDADPILSPYLQTSLSQHATLSNTPVDDIFDGSSGSSNPPSAATLRAITESVKTQLLNTIKPRSEICDRLMRELSGKRKERTERTRQREIEMAEKEAANARRKDPIVAITPKKRSHDGEARPLAVGAHGIARQDGGDTQTGTDSIFEEVVSYGNPLPRHQQSLTSLFTSSHFIFHIITRFTTSTITYCGSSRATG